MPAYHARIALEAHNKATNALIICVLHVEVDTLASPPNWGSIATDVDAWLSQHWQNMLSTADRYDQCVVTDENYPGSTHGQGVHVSGVDGTRTLTDTSLRPAVCGVVSWKTAVAKRYARGHNFLPPAYSSQSSAANGGWQGANAYYTSMIDFCSTFAGGHTAGSTSYVPEVFSKHLVTTGVTPFSNKITGFNVDGYQHWLRSRNTSP